MITRTINDKKYTLDKIAYDVIDSSESLYLQFKIEQDVEFGVRTYYYGLNFNSEELALMMGLLEGNFADYVVNKLIESNA